MRLRGDLIGLTMLSVNPRTSGRHSSLSLSEQGGSRYPFLFTGHAGQAPSSCLVVRRIRTWCHKNLDLKGTRTHEQGFKITSPRSHGIARRSHLPIRQASQGPAQSW